MLFFSCRLLTFFKSNFLKNSLRNTTNLQAVWIQNIGPDLGQNCFQKLSADDKSQLTREELKEIVNSLDYYFIIVFCVCNKICSKMRISTIT